MKKRVIAIALVLVILFCNAAIAEETVFGNSVEGDILFNNLEWGTSREEVFSFLKDNFNSNDVELEEECNEYEYGKVKQVVCNYSNMHYGNLGKVGDMDIDEITVWYIYEEGKYDYSMYAAQYRGESYSAFESMKEMLEYKYGGPYSYYEENSSSYGSTFDIDRFIWKNVAETQELWITRNNNALDFGILFGKSDITYYKNTEIYYSNAEMSSYVNVQREIYEAQSKEDEMAGKNYDGL